MSDGTENECAEGEICGKVESFKPRATSKKAIWKQQPEASSRPEAAEALLSIAEKATVFQLEDGALVVEWQKPGVFSGKAEMPFFVREDLRNKQIVSIWAEMQDEC